MPDRPTPAEPGTSALGRFLASLVAFLAPGAAVIGSAVLVSSVQGETITGGEWVGAAVAALVASAAGEARAARRVGAEHRRGEATALALKDEERT